MSRKNIPTGFAGLGIAPGLLTAVARLKFTEPTPIQRQAIPVGLKGRDLIAIAQTGTGKTLAFGIPMIQRLAQLKGRGLVLLPTRELAMQVSESLLSIGQSLGFRTVVIIGGVPEKKQKLALQKKPRLIVATPGRLVDFIEQGAIKLKDIKILVLDEADRMLDMGFAPQIDRIIRVTPQQRQTMLFSATMPQAILTLAHRNMQTPLNIEIAPPGTTVEEVVQEVFFIERAGKTELLEVLLADYHGPVLVFTRTKWGATKLARALRSSGHSAAEIHSDRNLNQRRQALEGFKSGKYRILVATDIAARGLDIIGIEVVVNYDLPTKAADYVHRIGRTARAGMTGRAISFATYDQRKEIRDIEQVIRTGLPIKPVPHLPSDKAPRELPRFVREKQREEKLRKPFGRRTKKKKGTGRL